MSDTPLNEEALFTAGDVIHENFGITRKIDHLACTAIAERAIEAYLSALPAPAVVETVDYLATAQGHYDAWTDTGDGYTSRNGWTLTCLWCGREFIGSTKRDALIQYQSHEEAIRQELNRRDAERAVERERKKETP